MANIIDNVAIQVDADLTLFDKKLQGIKNELKKIQKITVDIEQTGKAGVGEGAGIGVLGAAGIGGVAAKISTSKINSRGLSYASDAAKKTSKTFGDLSKSLRESKENFERLVIAQIKYKQSIPTIDTTKAAMSKPDISNLQTQLEATGRSYQSVQKLKDKYLESSSKASSTNQFTNTFSKALDKLKAKLASGEISNKTYLNSVKRLSDAFGGTGALKKYEQQLIRIREAGKFKIRIIDQFTQLTARAKSFGKQMSAIASRISVAFTKAFNRLWRYGVIAFAAINAYAVKAVMSFAAEEKALRNLGNAIDQYGEASSSALPALKEMAAAIQEQTGIEDDVTLARMASLRLLGVETDKLGEAAKAVIGLTKAGIGEETSIRAVAAARKGDFTMLTRYIPALRFATTEQGKAAAINDFVTKQYRSQKDELDTLSGRYNEFKTWVSEANEAVGKAISENLMLKDMFANLTMKIKELIASGKIKEWVDNIINSGKKLVDLLIKIGNVIKTIINYRFEISLGLMYAALVKLAIAAAPAVKNIWALAAAFFAYNKQIGFANASTALFGKLLMKTGVGAVAVGVGAIAISATQSATATRELQDSLTGAALAGDKLFKTFGTKNTSTLRTAMEMFQSGDPKKMETIRKLYPKIVSELERVKTASDELTDIPIDIAGVKALEDASKDTQKAFEALKKTVSQGTGATSIFDSVLEGMNTLIGGSGTMKIPEFLTGVAVAGMNRLGNGDTGSPELLSLKKMYKRVSGYFKDAGEIADGIGNVDVNSSTGDSKQVSMATQIVNAIQTQTETLVKSLTSIDKSIGNIAFVL